jgi:peptidoglycan/xylan/chitin deacetylase (PgdA/CDA1 family)
MAFFRLEGGTALPHELANSMPKILGIPDDALVPESRDIKPSDALRGVALGGAAKQTVSLAATCDGTRRLFFDLAATIEWILLEEYHTGLEPTAEMRLPFNYSRVPSWLKGLARAFRTKSLTREPDICFPPDDPPFVVEWLRQLGRWAGIGESSRLNTIRWPNDCRAAVAISHDVDTDWLFRHPDWLKRLVDVEGEYGLRGAWYCVPKHSQGRSAEEAIGRLIDSGCEVGCHGYNHDAKWPLLTGEAFASRVEAVRRFRDRWNLRGFRSEWLWRTPNFLTTLAGVFDYDSSIPTVSTRFTSHSRNGCGTCHPFQTYGGLIELPLTLPMDEERHFSGHGLDEFWRRQVARACAVVEQGGLVMISLHPQPHQAANPATLAAVSAALKEIVSIPNLWLARPDEIADWSRNWLRSAETACCP